MNTSELPPTGFANDDGDSLTAELWRLANQFFTAAPGVLPAESPLAHREPSAAQVGAGGASPAVTLPPVPGWLQQQPPSNAPAPTEAYLRALPGAAAELTGLGTSRQLAEAQPSALPSGESSAYFLELAGFPGGSPVAPPTAQPGAFPGAAPNAFPFEVPGPFPFDERGAPPLEAPSTSPSAAPGASPSAAPSASHDVPTRAALAPSARSASPGVFSAHAVRRDFPILEERVHGRPLVWLDNAATTHKPRAVIERLSYFYEHENSNIHRGAHTLAARATDAYEAARDKVRRFLNAPSTREIVFVRGGTEAINLVAQSYGRRNVNAGDEIVVTALEHHANIVPWQMLAKEKGARLRVVPVDDRGQVLLEDYERLLGPKTRLVSITHVSNALGTIVPVREMTAMAHRHGARVLLDGAQAVSHLPVDVQALDCDFYVFSGHKVFAPTGIGALYGKADVLEAMPPWQGGGNMISDVTFERALFQSPPARFEAGTGNIADAVGLGAAIDYVTSIGMPVIERYEHELMAYATEQVRGVPGLQIIGTAPDKAGVLSFVLDGQRTEDVGTALDQRGIAVRSGHHCAQPILRRFGLEATVRASFALYNTTEDIDALVTALRELQAGRP